MHHSESKATVNSHSVDGTKEAPHSRQVMPASFLIIPSVNHGSAARLPKCNAGLTRCQLPRQKLPRSNVARRAYSRSEAWQEPPAEVVDRSEQQAKAPLRGSGKRMEKAEVERLRQVSG